MECNKNYVLHVFRVSEEVYRKGLYGMPREFPNRVLWPLNIYFEYTKDDEMFYEQPLP